MLKNVLNKRNYNRSNDIKKYLHTLIIGIGIVFGSNNNVYATSFTMPPFLRNIIRMILRRETIQDELLTSLFQ